MRPAGTWRVGIAPRERSAAFDPVGGPSRRRRFGDETRTKRVVVVAVVGVLGTLLAATMAWSETSSDFASATVRGWEMWPRPILAFSVAWLVLPVIVLATRLSARWVVPLGVIQAVWAFRSAQGLEATGTYWFSPRTNVGSGPYALAFVGIVAATIALSIRRPSAWDEPNDEPD